MKTYVALLFFLLQFALASQAFATIQHTYGLLCNTCSTQPDFENFAIDMTPHLPGVSATTVANYNTNAIYTVTIEWEEEGGIWYADVTSVSLGS